MPPSSKKYLVFSLLLSKNGCCNAALRQQIDRGWRHMVQSRRHSLSDEYYMSTVLYVYSLSTKCIWRQRRRATFWVTASVQQNAPCLLLTFTPPAPRQQDGVNTWITDSYLQPDKVIAKATSSWGSDRSLVLKQRKPFWRESVSLC